jgi:hypothetical protein
MGVSPAAQHEREAMGFKIGQTVEWTSQANGTTKTKRGEIVAILPERECPRMLEIFGADYHSRYRSLVDARSLSRHEESYIVAVPGKTKRVRPRLYWPRVSALKAV